ncbi:hypothetical protein IVG45_20910 [Methylomonas sp. LL1]|uniref:hypothetical protein n=1 Tax=Methylomonas sp. LL1 TaxID=2785785 RepID=UPI0018C3F91B|nr:hypothetical protein [Methylomonas sp. LL1]QPK63235.1 hypothetical protein IVG45_20910 [Methylomonas sp. LL1]
MAHNQQTKDSMGKQVMAGTLATATVNTGGKLMSKVTKHPLLVFGLGMVAGYFVYKYRKDIIAGATKTIDAGKDFVLHQKENLEDLVAEAKEDK